MNKIKVLIFLTVVLFSCKTSEKEIEKLEIAKNYYKFLDNSDSVGMKTILGDSIVIRESADDYQEEFSKKEYIEWLNWDSVFEPTYKILEIKEENGTVEVKISKIDKRIYYLHEEPMIWNEIVRFEKNKIIRIERIKYEVFNVEKFLKKREELVSWINENHPELSGFLHEQSKSVGMKYLKAIELYENKK